MTHRDATGLARAARGMLAQQNSNVFYSLDSIRVPSLVVVGADDKPFLAASAYMTKKIKGCRKVVVPDAGHAANIDQPEAFIDGLMPFLEEVEGKGTKRGSNACSGKASPATSYHFYRRFVVLVMLTNIENVEFANNNDAKRKKS